MQNSISPKWENMEKAVPCSKEPASGITVQVKCSELLKKDSVTNFFPVNIAKVLAKLLY